jgi:peptide subunit release factor 1 (eRF1)
MTTRTGVFVCHCGINIAQTVDVKKVVDAVKNDPGVVHAENMVYACAQDSQAKIKELVKENGNAAYGEQSVRQNLETGAVDTLSFPQSYGNHG